MLPSFLNKSNERQEVASLTGQMDLNDQTPSKPAWRFDRFIRSSSAMQCSLRLQKQHFQPSEPSFDFRPTPTPDLMH
jgi:hypothetical protein